MQKFKGRKGQESAPFEVLIGVIIMGFVLYIGARALQELSDQECNRKLVRDVETFRGNLEQVVDLELPAKFDFRPPNCETNQRIRIEEIVDSAICASVCNIASPGCLSITVSSPYQSQRFCLRTALKTHFPTVHDICRDRRDEGFELIDLRDEMPPGHYELRNRTPAKQAFPTVCAYYRR